MAQYTNVACERCGSSDFISKGTYNGRQILKCRSCKKKVTVPFLAVRAEEINTSQINETNSNLNEGSVLSIETEKDGSQRETILLTLKYLKNKTPKQILETHGYDPLQWEFVSHQYKIWNAYSKKDGINDLYSSSIKVKPIQQNISKNSIEEVFKNLKIDGLKDLPLKEVKGKRLLEIPIMDLHLGKLSWEDETGFNYDLDIAEALFKKHFNNILEKVKNISDIEKIIYPIGQDFYNIDNDKNTTNAGTSQDVDGRWQKIFKRGLELNIWAIRKLTELKSGQVFVYYVPGNHDKIFSYFLVNSLESYYSCSYAVKVDTSPKVRKYIHYGNNMICFTHGQESKKQIDKMIQAEEPKIWGETKYREIHVGHLHSESLIEYPGFKIRRIGSLTATDKWHYESGYIGALRSLQAFIWNKENGLEYIIQSNE